MLLVKGQKLDVNYHEELEPHLDKFNRMRYRGEKLQCCSPFRHEKNPSFAVNLENGTWVDSGADSEEMRKGSFLTLLAFLREESNEETGDYLLDRYGRLFDDMDALTLSLALTPTETAKPLNFNEERGEAGIGSPYLLSRGISQEAINKFGIFEKGGAVALPWFNHKGELVNIKYRHIASKKFWYANHGQPIKNFLFGAYYVLKTGADVVWIVESEIDALYLWSCGIPAIATGGSSLSDAQMDLMKQLPLRLLVIATDNDTVGHRFANVIAQKFGGYFPTYRIQFPPYKKDVNEMSIAELMGINNQLPKALPVQFTF